jgi:predicted RNA-binding Zn-ribbon protein involved in translation (DUF1610 family)
MSAALQGLEPWPECARCGEEFPPKRKALGYHTCTGCGEQRARAEAARKAEACVVTHKSNVVYLGEGAVALDRLKDISRMRR